MEVDNGGVAELEGLEPSQQGSRLRILGQAGEDGVRGAAAVVQELDLLLVQAALGDEVPGEDVEDALAVELDPEEERLSELRPRDVVSLLVDDPEQDARLRRRAVHHRRGDAGDLAAVAGQAAAAAVWVAAASAAAVGTLGLDGSITIIEAGCDQIRDFELCMQIHQRAGRQIRIQITFL